MSSMALRVMSFELSLAYDNPIDPSKTGWKAKDRVRPFFLPYQPAQTRVSSLRT